jgi:pSer/pThr/pTyr-binding forkhead associated (FHA) protein
MKAAERRFVIGRAQECEIVLDDTSVSRRHAELVRTPEGRWLLVDRHSQNGTSIREGDRFRSISQEVVTLSDIVRFGSLTISITDLLQRAQFNPASTLSASPASTGSPAVRASSWLRLQRSRARSRSFPWCRMTERRRQASDSVRESPSAAARSPDTRYRSAASVTRPARSSVIASARSSAARRGPESGPGRAAGDG